MSYVREVSIVKRYDKRFICTVLGGMVLASCFSTATHAAETKVFPKYYEKKYIKEEDKATISEKVEALIKTMTEDEKLEMLGGNKEKLDKNGAAGYMVGVPRLEYLKLKCMMAQQELHLSMKQQDFQQGWF